MGVLDIFRKKTIEQVKRIRHRRFDGANTSRLFSTWGTLPTSADNDIRYSLKALVARSRDLAFNNDYISRYLQLIVNGVLGSTGMVLQNKATFRVSGKLDRFANDFIERSWRQWAEKYASFSGSHSLYELAKIAVESVARDGEVIVLLHRDNSNPFRTSIEILEADHLDVNYTDESKNIIMGIQYDDRQRPLRYYLFDKHPGSYNTITSNTGSRTWYEASNVLHIYLKKRPSQTRGIPWIAPVMTRIKNLAAYQEAEIIHKRIAASKMGFITPAEGESYQGDYEVDGDIYINVEPGEFEQLPPGSTFSSFDPSGTDTGFVEYVNRELKSIASGLNVSYHSLASDYDSASYSAGRLETLDERDYMRTIQRFFAEHFYIPVFNHWLNMSLLSGALAPLTLDRIESYNKPTFLSRTWDWVDPQKDINARIMEIKSGLTTMSKSLAEKGLDFQETIDQIAEEQEYMAEKGVSLPEIMEMTFDVFSGDENV